ncbi:MAG TPA: hypothetical protein VIY48_10685 [Candidatus Paceibacterota bacterium]
MKAYAKDVAERTVATFAVAFLSVFSFSDLSTWHDAAIAGGAATATLIKASLVNFLSK